MGRYKGAIVTGSEIRNIRRARGLTKVQLAALIGVSRQSINRWEREHDIEVKEEYEFFIIEITKQLPTIANIVKSRLEELRKYGYAV